MEYGTLYLYAQIGPPCGRHLVIQNGRHYGAMIFGVHLKNDSVVQY